MLALGGVVLFGVAACGPAEELDAERPKVCVALDLTALPGESAPEGPFAGRRGTLRDLRRFVNRMVERPHESGLFLQIGPMRTSIARSRDVADELARLRAADRAVHCHAQAIDASTLVFAERVCDRLTLEPGGLADISGISLTTFYAGTTLRDLGVDVDMIPMGRYKSAADALLLDEMPESTRESLGAVADTLFAGMVSGVAARASGDEARARILIDDAPYDAGRAEALALVDAAEHLDQARDAAREAAGATRVRERELRGTPNAPNLMQLLEAIGGEPPARGETSPHVAIVTLRGNIVSGTREGSGTIVDGPTIALLDRLRENDDVRGVVLRIDSPGGSALASDRIWRAVRRLEEAKPTVASVGALGASGGYYIAAGTDRIFAQPESLVGSIGVIGGKVSFGGLLGRVQIHSATIERGANAGWGSGLRPFDEGERAAIEALLAATYDRFIDRVATSREMSPASVREVAEGRVWTGRDASERGLVDELGGLAPALAFVRDAAEMSAESPIDYYPKPRGLGEVLAELFGTDAHLRSEILLALALGPEVGAEVEAALDVAFAVRGAPAGAVITPFWLRIQ